MGVLAEDQTTDATSFGARKESLGVPARFHQENIVERFLMTSLPSVQGVFTSYFRWTPSGGYTNVIALPFVS